MAIYRTAVLWAGIFGLSAVILGAFGAHALESRLTSDALASYQTGVRYHAWHTLAIFAVGLAGKSLPLIRSIVLCWCIGIFLFSFSIYLLSTQVITGSDLSWLGPVTPIGGGFLMAGWLLVIISAIRLKQE